MRYHYDTCGTCSRAIDFEIDDNGRIADIKFSGGCNGNTSGISALVIGMTPDEVISRLDGIKCGGKDTSCPDQLAAALKALSKN